MSTNPTLKSLLQKLFAYVFKRPLRNYNVEDRAYKAISSGIIRSAPRHDSTKAQLEEFARNNPQILEEQMIKPVELLERLKSVKVQEIFTSNIDYSEECQRSLPLDRSPVDVPDYGFIEPNSVPEGKVTLRQIVEFLTKHQAEPTVWDSERIAQDYKLDQSVVKDILENFRIFEVHFPDKRTGSLLTRNMEKINKYLPDKTKNVQDP